MKKIKIAYFYLMFFVVLLGSCTKNKQVKKMDYTSNDSIAVLIKNMRNFQMGVQHQLVYADSALHLASKNKNEKNINIVLGFKSYLLGLQGDYDGAMEISRTLLNKAVLKNDSVKIAEHRYRIAGFYGKKQHKDSAYIYYMEAIEIHQKLQDSSAIIYDLVNMAIIQSEFGNYTESDSHAVAALKLINGKDVEMSKRIYNCMAINAKEQKEYEEAIHWYDKSIELLEEGVSRNSYLNNKANAYRYLKEYDKAYKIWEALLKDSLLNKNPATKAKVIDNLAFSQWLENPEKLVLPELQEALSIRIAAKDLAGLGASYTHLSEYFMKKDPKQALMYAKKLFDNSWHINSTYDKLEALRKLIKLDHADNGKKYYTLYAKITDSISEITLKDKNQFAKLMYDTENNRAENLDLKIKIAESKLIEQREKTKATVLLMSGSSVVVLLLLIMYHRKHKYKLEKRAEVYKTEKQIAKKIHDEVANNVVHIMNKVQYTDESKYELLDDLEKVYLLTRDISHEHQAIETGTKYEHHLKSMLSSFKTTETTVILKGIHKIALTDVSEQTQIELYRILQELMTNMKKHSKATLVAVTFKKEGKEIAISYSDNGIGIVLNELNFKNGLQNVETRIKSIAGTINFESAPNSGLKAFIRFKE